MSSRKPKQNLTALEKKEEKYIENITRLCMHVYSLYRADV